MGHDSRAVSPVISVILMVAVVVILSATVSVFALSIGEDTSDVSPSVTFSIDYQDEQVVLLHAAGEAVTTSALNVTAVKGWRASADTLDAGERITANPRPDAESIDIVWANEQSSAILRTVDVSALDVRSLVVNDGFERGTDLVAEKWTQDTTFGTVDGAVERTNERSVSGEYSLKQVDITSSYNREFLSERVAVSGGQEYEFGGSYYLVGTADTPTDYRYSVRIKWLDEQGNEIDQEPFFGSDFGTFDSWTEVRLTATAPSNAATAQLRVRVKYTGSERTDVYWDEMFIEES